MSKKRLWIVLSVAGFAVGCGKSYSDLQDERLENLSANISYHKDDRTGLCFAAISSRTYGADTVVSIANVPCANVEKYIVKGKTYGMEP